MLVVPDPGTAVVESGAMADIIDSDWCVWCVYSVAEVVGRLR